VDGEHFCGDWHVERAHTKGLMGRSGGMQGETIGMALTAMGKQGAIYAETKVRKNSAHCAGP
jgi:hypothetical protein